MRRANRLFIRTVLPLLAVLVLAGAARADRHEGYYYPKVDSEETYKARAKTLPEATRARRIAFVTQLTIEQAKAAYAPRYAILVKGAQAEKMIIVALDNDIFSTLYRARGVMAQLSGYARSTQFFIEYGVEDLFTFYDLLKLLGFELLTITDGRKFAHQVVIE